MKKMKMIALVMGVVLMTFLGGCSGGSSGKLVVWSFTDELQTMINMFNAKEALGVDIEYTLTPTDQFPNRLDPVLRAGRGVPDVFALEANFVRRYIESGLLLDITDVYEEVRGHVLDYPVEIATYEGKVYGMSWQATPGAMFYRRSLAKQYLGTDDPAVVQTYFDSWDKFLTTAQRLKQESGGRAVVTASVGELRFPFSASRSQPWVVDGQLNIDPAMIDYLELAKFMRDNGLDGRTDPESESWFASMSGALSDETGNPVEVFSYILPTWGLHYWLVPNSGNTSGDWAMIAGPAPWFRGGTWVAAYGGTKNPDMAKDFIRLLTTNEANLEKWARETGDFLNNMTVVDRIKDIFSMDFLGGQNHYAAFAEMAPGIDGSIIQGTDQAIDSLFLEALNQYIIDGVTRDAALDGFRSQVQAQLNISARN